MRLVDFLTKARWTKGSMAKDAGHRSMDPNAPEACRWCLSGAVDLCYPDVEENCDVRMKIDRYLSCLYLGELINITRFNDRLATWSGVQKLLQETQI